MSKNILVIEDDNDFRGVILMALVGQDYNVLGAATLREGSFKIRNQKFDCILLDIRLGNDSGTEIINIIKKNKNTPNTDTPIIVISGFLDRPLVENIAKDIKGALVKPFSAKELIERLHSILNA